MVQGDPTNAWAMWAMLCTVVYGKEVSMSPFFLPLPLPVCTAIDQDRSGTNPSVLAFFGRTLLLYVYVFSDPRPQQTHDIFLGSTKLENSSEVSVFQLSSAEPRFSFEYSISIPFAGDDVQDSDTALLFTATFEGVCSGNPHIAYWIPVISRGGMCGPH